MTGPATEKQLALIKRLADQKGYQKPIPEGLTKEKASIAIERFLRMPDAVAEAKPEPKPEPKATVPDGRYAITGEDGTTDFYRVKNGKGKWAGRIFVTLLLGSPGDLREQNVSRVVTGTVLHKIIEDGPEAACKRFGSELGVCGICGSPLTDPESIALGIGPVCRKRFAA